MRWRAVLRCRADHLYYARVDDFRSATWGMVDKVPYEYIIKIHEDRDEYQPDNYGATVNLICAPGNHFRRPHDESPHESNVDNVIR